MKGMKTREVTVPKEEVATKNEKTLGSTADQGCIEQDEEPNKLFGLDLESDCTPGNDCGRVASNCSTSGYRNRWGHVRAAVALSSATDFGTIPTAQYWGRIKKNIFDMA